MTQNTSLCTILHHAMKTIVSLHSYPTKYSCFTLAGEFTRHEPHREYVRVNGTCTCHRCDHHIRTLNSNKMLKFACMRRRLEAMISAKGVIIKYKVYNLLWIFFFIKKLIFFSYAFVFFIWNRNSFNLKIPIKPRVNDLLNEKSLTLENTKKLNCS